MRAYAGAERPIAFVFTIHFVGQFSSMEWLHPDFRGEVIRDDEDYDNWPMKHDWYATTQYPEGLWEVCQAVCLSTWDGHKKKRCAQPLVPACGLLATKSDH